MRFAKNFIILAGSVALSACATIIDNQTQPVKIVTPGAAESQCYADNGVKHSFRNGDTVNVQRSRKPLVIECYGAGNRYKKKTVESTFNDWTAANVSNAVVPGATYDALSGGMWEYPDVIEVSFIGMPVTGFELPEYHNRDAPNPYEQSIESYAPSTPRIETDRGTTPHTIERRDPASMSTNPFETFQSNNAAPLPYDGAGGATSMPYHHSQSYDAPVAPSMYAPAPPAHVPSTAPAPVLHGTNAEELTRAMNPQVFGGN